MEERTIVGKRGDAVVFLSNSSKQISWKTDVRFPTGKINSPDRLTDFIQDVILKF